MAVFPVNKRRFILWLRFLRGNARRRIPHRVLLGRRSAAQRFLLRFRAANHKRCNAMGSADGKPLMARCTCRIEKRGTELLTGVLGARASRGGDGGFAATKFLECGNPQRKSS